MTGYLDAAFRLKMRIDALAARAETDPTTYETQTKLGREIATVLRKNIVQAVKVVEAKDDNEKETWSEQCFIYSSATTTDLTWLVFRTANYQGY